MKLFARNRHHAVVALADLAKFSGCYYILAGPASEIILSRNGHQEMNLCRVLSTFSMMN